MVTISMRLDCKQLIIDIEDTGTGIQPDHQQRIFEPYEKVDVHSTGAGLGLTLASKFATLLHGSVILVSSDIGRGSHFRVTFREVECACSPPPRLPLALKLKNIPSKFHRVTPGSDGVLCDFFTRFLTYNGFSSLDSMENCFVILDFVPDLEQRSTYLSQIRLGQVAICLIPASEVQACYEQTSSNVVYVTGPFLTSTMSLALEKADILLSENKAFQSPLPEPDETPLILSRIDAGPSTDEETGSMADSFRSEGQTAQPPTEHQGHLDSSAVALPTYQPDAVAPAKARVVIPVFSALSGSPRPTALLVDDNVVNLRIMQMYCRKRGLPHCCATDGLQAVKAFLQHQSLSAAGDGDAIQLILMDLQMPVCDGIEATRQIRLLEKQNKWRESVLFVVTGQDSPTDRAAAEGAGANEFFVKPVGMKLLDRVLKRYFPAFDSGYKPI